MKASCRLGLMIVVVLAASSACGSTADSSGTAGPTGEPTQAATRSTVPARPEIITAACPLLPADEVVRVLGGTEGGGLEATEGAKETGPSGGRFRCTYGRGGRQALVLGVAEQAGDARGGVDAAVAQSGVAGTDVAGLGDAAATYTVGGFNYLVAAVSRGNGHRLVFLGAPAVVPKTKLAELAAGVVKRI